MTEIIHIENGYITKHAIITDKPKEGDVVLNGWWGTVGDPVDFYNDDWTKKSEEQLVKEGLVEPPLICCEDEVVEEEIVQELPEESFRKTVEEIIPQGFKKDDDGNIVPKTPEELYKDGDWTDKDWNNYQIAVEKDYLYQTDWVVIKTIELQMKGEKSEHDYTDIIRKRGESRARINELEAELAELGEGKEEEASEEEATDGQA